MTKFNEFDMALWKTALADIRTDSLWVIDKRDNIGKHSNFYHGNFIPQIPRQFIKRFTKRGEVVLDPFMGGGTTAFECQSLGRNFVGMDIKMEMVDYVRKELGASHSLFMRDDLFSLLYKADATQTQSYFQAALDMAPKGQHRVHLVILHPPYFDVIRFSDDPADLSNSASLGAFLEGLSKAIKASLRILDPGRYLVLVMGDKYSKGRYIPLGFQAMQLGLDCGLTLKAVIVKNINNNQAKQGINDVWRYRALTSDYYIFKHEYIFLFKKPV